MRAGFFSFLGLAFGLVLPVAAADSVVVPRFTHPGAGQTIYVVMPDRFANGRADNDTGHIPGGPDDHGFDPTRISHYHGGDFAGLTARLDYIQGLGITPDIEVHETRTDEPSFGPSHEADLRGAITNTGGAPQNAAPPRNDLPAIAKDIPKLPPEGQPKYDPADFKTDFQLQQALRVLHAMPVAGAAR